MYMYSDDARSLNDILFVPPDDSQGLNSQTILLVHSDGMYVDSDCESTITARAVEKSTERTTIFAMGFMHEEGCMRS